ncbi:FACT complex subunit spt16 [Phlyctochytrium bullatum]|nr:FACT complex subunit spt16 [Phlyctochytrium bullatum]
METSMLAGLKDSKALESIPVEFLIRGKDENVNKGHFATLVAYLRESGEGKKVGVLLKDKVFGKFVKEWREVMGSSQLEEVDVTPGIATVLSVKDADDLVQ